MLTLRLALTFALASTAFSFPNAGAGADQHRLSRVVRRHHLRRSQAQSQDGGPDGGAGGAGGTGQTQSGGSGGSPGGSDGGDSGGDGSGGALSSLIPTGLSPTNTDGGAGDPTTTPTSDPDPTSGSDPDPKSSPTAEPKAKPKPTDGGDGGSPTSSGGDPTPTGGPGGDTGDGGATVGSDGVATLTKPVGDGVSDPTGWLDVHNAYRKQYSSPPLAWDDDLASTAQTHSDQCVFAHTSNNPNGENLAVGQKDLVQVVGDWVNGNDEKNKFDPDDNGSNTFSHFTQVVWANTTHVGCAVKQCDSVANFGSNAPLWTCEYHPAGNVIGDFKGNVHARKGGAPD